MKKLALLLQEKHPLGKSLPFFLAAMALLLTGCPNNEYEVQLKPQGVAMERTLIFYRANGINTNTGAPNYQPFGTNELSAIAAVYPVDGLITDDQRHIARGIFTNSMPDDVGGAGAYTNLTTSLGEAGFYEERFRGNDDLAAVAERRFKAADTLADLILGWSRMELGREPGYDKLRRFLGSDFRHDLKNVSEYWSEALIVENYKTNGSDEFALRLGQYGMERGYFNTGDLAPLFSPESRDTGPTILRHAQRLVARKMGIPDSEPIPASLAFLGDKTNLEKSLDKYLAGTKLYHAKLKQWKVDRKLKPNLEKPEPEAVINDAVQDMVALDLNWNEPAHLVVRLSLPSAPCQSNGRWDETLKQVVWTSDITGRTNATGLPTCTYASWAQADGAFQMAHLGKVALTNSDLRDYCLWRCSLDAKRGGEWDAFLANLQPGAEWTNKLDAFRFSDEPVQTVTKLQKNSGPSVYPRELIKTALK